jgi:hypothetical protein
MAGMVTVVPVERNKFRPILPNGRKDLFTEAWKELEVGWGAFDNKQDPRSLTASLVQRVTVLLNYPK